MMPNETARDKTLSFRSRGVLTFLMSQREGWRITSETIAAEGQEGRDAVRTALTQLETSGYIRRYRERMEDGTYRGICDVYPYGDATGAPNDIDVDNDTDEPAPENPSQVEPAPENPAQVSQAPYRRLSTEDSPDSPDAAVSPSVGGEQSGNTPLPAVVEPEGDLTSSSTEEGTHATGAVLPPVPPFPRYEQETLASWFNVTDGEPWVRAWTVVCTAKTAVEYDPQVHLNSYLIRCKDQNQRPRADLWLRWFIEDREKYARSLAAEEERLANEIDPQEREERDNKRLPPADWGVPTEGESE